MTQLKVTDALALDFKHIPRVECSGNKHIALHKRRYATGEERVLTLIAVKTWGWSKDLTYTNQL